MTKRRRRLLIHFLAATVNRPPTAAEFRTVKRTWTRTRTLVRPVLADAYRPVICGKDLDRDLALARKWRGDAKRARRAQLQQVARFAAELDR